MANSTFTGTRNFSAMFNVEKASPNFNYLSDPTVTWTSPNGQSYTGGWRPMTPADLETNITIDTGTFTISVSQNVAVTGSPFVQIGNFPSSQNVAITGQPLNITGNINVTNPALTTLNVAVTGNPYINITGNPTVTLTGTLPVNVVDSLNVTGNISAVVTNALAITGNPIVTLTGNQNVNIVNSILAISGIVTDNGNLVNALVSGNNYNAPASKTFSTGLVSYLLAKTGVSTLFSVNGYNSYTSTQFIQVYDNVNSGANLMSVLLVEPTNNFFLDFGAKGISMNSGIFVCNSTTSTGQVNGAANLFLTIGYK